MLRFAPLLAGLVLIGCGGDAPEPAIQQQYTVRAVYLGAVHDSAAAAVHHEPIPDLMPAMRMELRVADRALLRGLQDGDKVRLRLVDRGHGLVIEAAEPLPPETELDLGVPADSLSETSAAPPDRG